MISHRTYDHLLISALSPASSAISLHPSLEVNGTFWGALERVYSGELTGFDPTAYTAHMQWPDRYVYNT